MVLILFYDGSKVEIPHCEDVVYNPGCLICVDHLGAPIVSFLDIDVAGYTLGARVITALRLTPESDRKRA